MTKLTKVELDELNPVEREEHGKRRFVKFAESEEIKKILSEESEERKKLTTGVQSANIVKVVAPKNCCSLM